MFNRIPFNHNNHISPIYTHSNGATLWVGDYQSAVDMKLLDKLAINAVLTAADSLKVQYDAQKKKIDHYVIRALDMPSYKIKKHFPQSNKFIYENLALGKNVLVHCAAGISRSVTLVIAFLMNKLNFDYKKALQHVRDRRPCANPNYGFIQELKSYQQHLQQKRTYKALKNYSRPDTNQNQIKLNQASLILDKHKQLQKQKLSYAFQINKSNNKGKSDYLKKRGKTLQKQTDFKLNLSKVNTNLIKMQSGKYMQSFSKGSPKNSIGSQKLKNMRQYHSHRSSLIQNQHIRKRVQTQNNILFPKIILIKRPNYTSQKN